jgi:uridine kinase
MLQWTSNSSVFPGPLLGENHISYLLQHIFPNIAYILHADDFCKEFADIPTMNGNLDCDGPGAIDYVLMPDVLDELKEHRGMPSSTGRSWQEEVFPRRTENAVESADREVIGGLSEGIKKFRSSA